MAKLRKVSRRGCVEGLLRLRSRPRRPSAHRSGGRLAALALLVLLGAPSASAQADVPWNRYQLEQWILGQRPATPAALAAELPTWPEWPGRCHGLDTYVANVGAEFRRRCGPVVEEKVDDARKACLEGSASPIELLRRLPGCVGDAATLPFWVKQLGTCALTSYVTAAEMSEQDREDWITRIDGLSDLRSLLGLGEVLDAGRLAGLAGLGEAQRPQSVDDLAKLFAEAKALGKEQVDRYERLVEAVDELSGLRAALLTEPSLRRAAIADLGEAAASAVVACRPERARELATVARLEAIRHVQHRRTNLAIAEHAYHCLATRGGFDGWAIARQRQFLRSGPDSGVWNDDPHHMGSNEWRGELRQLAEAQELFVRLDSDSRLGEEALAAAAARRAEHESRWVEAAAAARSCLATCGERRDGCTLPLSTLEQHLRNLGAHDCAREETARRLDGSGLLATLGRAEATLAQADALVGRADASIDAALAQCDLDRARRALEEASGELGALSRRAGWGPVCGADRLAEAAATIQERRRAIELAAARARGSLQATREALPACQEAEAEAHLSEAWDALLAPGCPLDAPALAAVRAETDALQAEVERNRTARAAERDRLQERAALLLERIRTGTQGGESDEPARCAALGEALAAADALAALAADDRCVEGSWAAEADAARARLDRAWERGRAGFDLWMAQAESSRDRCDLAGVTAAIDGIRAAGAVCGVDSFGALARLESLRAETERRRRANDATCPGAPAAPADEWQEGVRDDVVDPCAGPRPAYRAALAGVLAAVSAQNLDGISHWLGALRPECPGDAERLQGIRDQAVALARAQAEQNRAEMSAAVGAAREREHARAAAWAAAAGVLQGMLAEIQRAEAGAPLPPPADTSALGGGAGTGAAGPPAAANAPSCLVEGRVDTSAGSRVFYVVEAAVSACGRSFPSFGIRGSSGGAPLAAPGFSGPFSTLAAAQAEVDRRCPIAVRATGSVSCL